MNSKKMYLSREVVRKLNRINLRKLAGGAEFEVSGWVIDIGKREPQVQTQADCEATGFGLMACISDYCPKPEIKIDVRKG